MHSLQPQTRKRVREPTNDKFASIKGIAEAKEALGKAPKRKRRARSEDRAQQLEEVREMIIHGLDMLHRLEEMD